MHKDLHRKVFYRIKIFIGLYIVLWGITLIGGVPDMEIYHENYFNTKLIGRRSSSKDEAGNDLSPPGMPWYYIDRPTAIAPFLIKIRSGYRILSLDGEGTVEYYIWIFGVKFRIYAVLEWFA